MRNDVYVVDYYKMRNDVYLVDYLWDSLALNCLIIDIYSFKRLILNCYSMLPDMNSSIQFNHMKLSKLLKSTATQNSYVHWLLIQQNRFLFCEKQLKLPEISTTRSIE